MKSTKEMIEVMQAYEDGKTIEVCTGALGWKKIDSPLWDWCINDYRVKPEPTYRPYESIDELKKDYIERVGTICSPLQNPNIWTVFKTAGGREALITGIDCKTGEVKIDWRWWTLFEVYENFTYLDGTPCGKLLEE